MSTNALSWLAKQIVWESRLDQLRSGKPASRKAGAANDVRKAA